MRVELVPLDERPANTHDPGMTGAVAGASVVLPPADLLSHRREPAVTGALGEWPRDEAASFDALVVSCEMLADGGLIASRVTGDPLDELIGHLAVVRERPNLPILDCTVVTRIAADDHAMEEPADRGQHGRSMAPLSRVMDRQSQGLDAGAEVAATEDVVSAVVDWLESRLADILADLAGKNSGWRVIPGSVACPWGRTVEVDFRLDAGGEV